MPSRPKRHPVVLTLGARHDLESLHAYVAEFDSPSSADRLLDRLMETVESLERFPERGTYPAELLALGMRDFRQTSMGPYRVIYRVTPQSVIVHVIADGRRRMQTLLARRLIEPPP